MNKDYFTWLFDLQCYVFLALEKDGFESDPPLFFCYVAENPNTAGEGGCILLCLK
jgi:hypothetical protein